ncbi:MAG: glycosyltransferase [Bacteroidetes bacterium]|nr:glycosyltransferase [Bacteroidota bacterium]
MISGKTIFIAPLDWGLGHATRCVPIIKELQKENKIIIGVTALTKKVFDEEFPDICQINIPAYNIKYSRVLPLWLKLFFGWPGISTIIKKENAVLQKIILEHKIDVVISDNRFGLYSNTTHSVFITHQVFLKTPFATGIAQGVNKNYILNFNEIWIPDLENEKESLSAELSHGQHFHPQVKYIGPKTRLQKTELTTTKYDHLFLLSGPEPQHSILRELLVKKAKQYPHLKFGMVTNECDEQIKNLEIFISPNAQMLSELISQSKKIICRSGYSTLMDLYLLDKKEVILIPTPGQTEQEYLAEYWRKKFGAEVCVQKNISKYNF